MVLVTVVVEEAVTVTISMVPELELVEEAVEHEMNSEMVKEASVVTPVATTTDVVVVLTSANSAIVTHPVAQPALSKAATAPAQPTPEMMQPFYTMMQQYPSNVTGNRGGGRGSDRDNRNGTGTGTGGRGGRA